MAVERDYQEPTAGVSLSNDELLRIVNYLLAELGTRRLALSYERLSQLRRAGTFRLESRRMIGVEEA